ncbi:MAG TPA: hypothetical protein GXX40_09495 [Firmicutes bacterium]|nr:hypothetical protein [Bacillota bacterium]
MVVDREDTNLLARLNLQLERAKIGDYVQLLEKPTRLLYLNFIAGLARGLGAAIGFTVLGALVMYILTRSFIANLPLIGKFVAEIVAIVQDDLLRRR